MMADSSQVATSDLREKVKGLEESLNRQPQVDCPVRHYFAPGLYAREITIPKGTVLVGAVHKKESLVVLSAGALRLATENGPIDVHAPYTMNCKPGSKNAAYALETAVWTNFFANPDDEQDVDVLVEVFTESKASELLGGVSNKQLAQSGAMEKLEG